MNDNIEDISAKLEGNTITAQEFNTAYNLLYEIFIEPLKNDSRLKKWRSYSNSGFATEFFVKKNNPQILGVGSNQLVLALPNEKSENHLCAKLKMMHKGYRGNIVGALGEDYYILGNLHQSDIMITSHLLRTIRDIQKLDYILPYFISTRISSNYHSQNVVDITVDLTQGNTCDVIEASSVDFNYYENGEQLKESFIQSVNTIKDIRKYIPLASVEPASHLNGPNPEPFERIFFIVNKKDTRNGYLVANDLNNIRFTYN